MGGSLLLGSEGDRELVFPHPRHGHSADRAGVLHLSAEVDENAFATGRPGALYVVDSATGDILKITGRFGKGQAFASAASLGTVDLKTGEVTPFGAGVTAPKGLLCLPGDDHWNPGGPAGASPWPAPRQDLDSIDTGAKDVI